MPPEGLEWLPNPALLSDDEVIRLARIGVQRLGITEIRFTGGEPLLRRGLPGIVARAAELRPRPEISLTTNGIGLARLADPLRAAGLDRINVSLDTLNPETFRSLSRRDRLDDVLAGMASAHAAGLRPVKVNSVLMRGLNEGEAPALLEYCLDRGYRAALHRADAAGRAARLAAGEDGHRGRDPRRADPALQAHRGRPRRARLGPGRDVPGGRRPGAGRRDRLGHPAVLRHVRPGPADR